MTPAEFRALRHQLGLSTRAMGILLRLAPRNAGRTVRRYEAGRIEISPRVVALARLAADTRGVRKALEDMAARGDD